MDPTRYFSQDVAKIVNVPMAKPGLERECAAWSRAAPSVGANVVLLARLSMDARAAVLHGWVFDIAEGTLRVYDVAEEAFLPAATILGRETR